MKEVWKPIPGYTNYEVSNIGRVRSIDHVTNYILNRTQKKITIKGRVIKQFLDRDGYYRTSMFVKKNGKNTRPSIPTHRLVWMAFKGSIPPKYVINHLDFNRGNNNLTNLDCCTVKENDHYSMSVGRKSKKHLSNEDIQEIRKSKGFKEMAEKHKLDRSTIWHIKKKKIYGWVPSIGEPKKVLCKHCFGTGLTEITE